MCQRFTAIGRFGGGEAYQVKGQMHERESFEPWRMDVEFMPFSDKNERGGKGGKGDGARGEEQG